MKTGDAFTIEFWFKPTATVTAKSGIQYLMSGRSKPMVDGVKEKEKNTTWAPNQYKSFWYVGLDLQGKGKLSLVRSQHSGTVNRNGAPPGPYIRGGVWGNLAWQRYSLAVLRSGPCVCHNRAPLPPFPRPCYPNIP